MNIIFDSNSFSHFIGLPEYNDKYKIFLQNTKDNEIKHIGTTEFCTELFLLYPKNKKQYYEILNKYWPTVNQGITLPFNEIIKKELANKTALSFYEKTISCELVDELEYLMYHPNNTDLELNIINQKVNYENTMNTALSELFKYLQEHGHIKKNIRNGFKKWYSSISIFLQDWFESSFKIKGVNYTELPHTRAFLDYFLYKHFEVINLSTKHKKNDYFDRAFYTVSASTGILITDDNNLLKIGEEIDQPNVNLNNLDYLYYKL